MESLADYSIESDARCARFASRGGEPPTPPLPRGWVRNKRPECPVYLGFWICAVCVKTGWDLRPMLCPWGE